MRSRSLASQDDVYLLRSLTCTLRRPTGCTYTYVPAVAHAVFSWVVHGINIDDTLPTSLHAKPKSRGKTIRTYLIAVVLDFDTKCKRGYSEMYTIRAGQRAGIHVFGTDAWAFGCMYDSSRRRQELHRAFTSA